MTRTGTTALTLSDEIRQRFDEFSRSQKDVGQYIVDHLEEAAFHTAEELARRANTSSSTVVRFAQALGFEGFPELQAAARDEYRRARESGAGGSDLSGPPLFPIDQTEFEAALAADHSNVVETARKVDRDEVAAAIDLVSHAERIVLCGTDQMAFFASYLRHLLMLLDLRAEVVASPSQENLGQARPGERQDGDDRVLGGPPASARGARHEARPQPQRRDDRDRRRHALRGGEAGRPPALLLVEQPRLRPLARRPARLDPGARLRRVRDGRARLRGSHQGVSAEVGALRLSGWRVGAAREGEGSPGRRPGRGASSQSMAAPAAAAPRGCDPLDPAHCLLPWPNDHFRKDGAARPAQRHDAPQRRPASRFAPADYNRSDGFSPGQIIVTRVPRLDLRRQRRGAGDEHGAGVRAQRADRRDRREDGPAAS